MSDKITVVILVHGFTNNPSDFGLWIKKLQQEQILAHTIPYYRNDTVYEPLEKYAEALANFITNNEFKEELTLIGFSMGGLVIRYYLQNLYDKQTPVKHVFTVATPHYGSDMATLSAIGGIVGDILSKIFRNKPLMEKSITDTSLMQFLPLSPFIKKLNTNTPAIQKIYNQFDFLNIWLRNDIVISPAGNAIAPFKEIINREISTNIFHNLVLKPRGLQEILIDEIIPVLKKQKRRSRKGPQTLTEWKGREAKLRNTLKRERQG